MPKNIEKNIFYKRGELRKPQKRSSFLSEGATKRGGGG